MSRWVLLAVVLIGSFGCGNKTKFHPTSAHETLLSVAAEYELLASTNPYTEAAPRDLLGQHIAKATLVRLSNYTDLHPGRFTPEVLVLIAHANERLGDYRAAIDAYREAAIYDSPLQEKALERIEVNEARLEQLARPPKGTTIDDRVELLIEQSREFRRRAEEATNELDRGLDMVESENAAVACAELLAAYAFVLADGETRARDAYRSLRDRYRDSHRSLEHALAEAAFLRATAERELRLTPPERLGFDGQRVMGLIDEALDIVYRVSQADGREARIIAARELDVLLALRDQTIQRAR